MGTGLTSMPMVTLAFGLHILQRRFGWRSLEMDGVEKERRSFWLF